MLVGVAGLALAPLARAPFACAQERAVPRPPSIEGREPVDAMALTREERRHVPVLVLPRAVRAGRPFDFVAQIGVEPHVMTEAHYIEWIELYLDAERVFSAELGARVAYPIVRVPLALVETAHLTVRSQCNLHGIWRTRRPVPVT